MYSWLNTREEVLIGYIVVQIICILLATVLPNWFIRKVVQANLFFIIETFLINNMYVMFVLM